MFNRGITNPGLFAGRAELVAGDRTNRSDLGRLAGRSWDAAVDVAAYHPSVVGQSLAVLGGSVRRYLFVSTVSVYADQRRPNDESSPVLELSSEEGSFVELYGPRKAACEDLVRTAFGDAATVVRPGLIVGPHDQTDRFSYWPRRIGHGGRVLAPGAPADPLQFIDVRDLARFMLRLTEYGTGGTFNATGPSLPFSELLATCCRVCGSRPNLVWVPSAALVEAGLDPWMGVPLWIGEPGWEAANQVVVTRALEAGLSVRPLDETVRAVLEGPPPPANALSSFTPQREQELLEALGLHKQD